MNLRHYISLLHQSLIELVEAFSDVADAHGDEPDVRVECEKFAEADDSATNNCARFSSSTRARRHRRRARTPTPTSCSMAPATDRWA